MTKSGSGGAVQAEAKSHRASAPSVALSAPRRLVKARSYTPKQIKDRLEPWQVLSICKDWLPDGRRQGEWWVAKSPWRDDRNPSLGVSLTTKTWRDFATGEHGDIFDLSMRLFGDSLRHTLDGFADMLGITNA
jgi:hypothetical protein